MRCPCSVKYCPIERWPYSLAMIFIFSFPAIKFSQSVIKQLVKVCEEYSLNDDLLRELPPPAELSFPVSKHAFKNSRRTMEDRFCVVEDLNGLFGLKVRMSLIPIDYRLHCLEILSADSRSSVFSFFYYHVILFFDKWGAIFSQY